jgi:hypothetical protein
MGMIVVPGPDCYVNNTDTQVGSIKPYSPGDFPVIDRVVRTPEILEHQVLDESEGFFTLRRAGMLALLWGEGFLLLVGVALIIAASAPSWMPDNPFTSGIGGAPHVHATLGGKPRHTTPGQPAPADPANPGNIVTAPPATSSAKATTTAAPDQSEAPEQPKPSSSASSPEEPALDGPSSDPADPPVSTPTSPDTTDTGDNPATLETGSDPGPEQPPFPSSDATP